MVGAIFVSLTGVIGALAIFAMHLMCVLLLMHIWSTLLLDCTLQWHKRVKLFPDNPTKQILTYTEAVKVGSNWPKDPV